MSAERDELAGLIAEADGSGHFLRNGRQYAYGPLADAILAAGYRKPQQITTTEELDALGRFSAIMEQNGSVWVNDGQAEDPWASFAEDPYGGPIWTDSSRITLPATVLHVGGAE